MIERDGLTFEAQLTRGLPCECNGCTHAYSSIIVDHAPGSDFGRVRQCRRCYEAWHAKYPEFPTFDEILSDAGVKTR